MDKHSRSYPLYNILLMLLDKSDRSVLNNNYLGSRLNLYKYNKYIDYIDILKSKH